MKTLIIFSLIFVAGWANKSKLASSSRNPAGLFGSSSSVKKHIGGIKISMKECLIGLHIGNDDFEYVTLNFKHLEAGKECKKQACKMASEYSIGEAEISYTGIDSYRSESKFIGKKTYYELIQESEASCYKE